MAYEKKNGDIAVFRQDNANPKAPQWKGEALIDGKVYEVAFWEKSETMLAGNIKPKGEKKPYQEKPSYKAQAPLDDDSIPF